MVLMRLRLGLLLKGLAHRFDTCHSTVSKVINDWLNILYIVCQAFVVWPSRRCIKRNLPIAFQNETFKKVRGIIDCTEVFIQKPSGLNARAQSYSSYKGHNTVKFLVISTPSGGISFISKASGGRATDQKDTAECGILNLVHSGDVFLVDRGFNCEELFATKSAKLLNPAFTKGKAQLTGEEVILSRKYSNVRIHVERRIERLKNYRILSRTLPISVLKRASDVDVSTIDKILVVCAALSNMEKPIIKIGK
ncbi:hypothetical protein JTE90_028988 [Oedothorax gibbosus]|uniref:DDE Tnp4 domain-containing protein n=1 Tax=Oedothorax gibbosus TaxID=931172 RepID=A0AAV6VIR1_9ARAC|nr:hypothetical protein JTE90_028988 [Oedothorax gibbosus]